MAKCPTCIVKGPAGEVVINESDLHAYESRGYKKAGAKAAAKAPAKTKEAPKAEKKK